MIRRFLFQVHMWTGLVLGVLFVLLGLSGSVLVYNDAINRLTEPMPRASLMEPAQSLDALIAAARAADPEPPGLTLLELPKRPGDPAVVRFLSAGQRAIYVDPVTAKVLGSHASVLSPVVQFAHDLHGNLLLGATGRPLVGWLGVAMLLLGVSGLVLWWPSARHWKYAFVVRRGAKGLRFHRELHGAIGIWGFIVFIVVSFTGIGMVFSGTLRSTLGGSPPPAYSVSAGASGIAPMGADGAAALARAALPGDGVRSVMLRPGQPTNVAMSPSDSAPIYTLVFIDPYRGKVIAVRDPATLPGTEAFLAWQKPLHIGDGPGPIWRFLVFLSGLMPAVFVITGMTMWLTKRRNRIAMSKPLAE